MLVGCVVQPCRGMHASGCRRAHLQHVPKLLADVAGVEGGRDALADLHRTAHTARIRAKQDELGGPARLPTFTKRSTDVRKHCFGAASSIDPSSSPSEEDTHPPTRCQ